MKKFMVEAIFNMSSIELQAKDPTTKSVVCAADFNVEMPNHSSYASIAYKVEIGTDAKLNATILEMR